MSVAPIASSDDPADVARPGEIDRQREDEEEQRGKDVAEGEEALLDVLPDAALGEDHAGHQGADRLGELELLRDGAHRDHEAEHRQEEELELEALEQAPDPRTEPA